MKARMLLAAIALAAVICAVVVLANPDTNSCLAFLWSGPPGVEGTQWYGRDAFLRRPHRYGVRLWT